MGKSTSEVGADFSESSRQCGGASPWGISGAGDSRHLKQTSGLGFINQSTQQGIKAHSCFAVSGRGEPLGILHQQHWIGSERTGKREERRKKATCDKESGRWLETLTAAESSMNESMCLVHVGDREADIYVFMT